MAPAPSPSSSGSEPRPSGAPRYRELVPPPELVDLLICQWRQDVGAGGHVQRVVPDGCVDLIWRPGRGLVVAGPATQPVLARLPGPSTTVGLRLRPGTGAAVLGLPLSELRDLDVPLEQLWAGDLVRRLTDAMADAPSTEARLALLSEAVLRERSDAGSSPDPLVAAAARRMAVDDGAADVRVSALGAELGVSERQLLRRFRASVGYGPKTLARVLRFQRFLAAAWGPTAAASPVTNPVEAAGDAASGEAAGGVAAGGVAAGGSDSLARLALDVGYADQAHLARECRALAGMSPRRLLSGA